jgi:hypothetical protein
MDRGGSGMKTTSWMRWTRALTQAAATVVRSNSVGQNLKLHMRGGAFTRLRQGRLHWQARQRRHDPADRAAARDQVDSVRISLVLLLNYTFWFGLQEELKGSRFQRKRMNWEPRQAHEPLAYRRFPGRGRPFYSKPSSLCGHSITFVVVADVLEAGQAHGWWPTCLAQWQCEMVADNPRPLLKIWLALKTMLHTSTRVPCLVWVLYPI